MSVFIHKALQWASSFPTFLYLDSNQMDYPHEPFMPLLAVSESRNLVTKNSEIHREKTSFDRLYDFWKQKPTWLFGFLGYDLKNELEEVFSKNKDHLNFPNLYFFEAQTILFFDRSGNLDKHKTQGENQFGEEKLNKIIREIEAVQITQEGIYESLEKPKINCRFSEKEYLKTVQTIQNHIKEGDVYELNLCVEFLIEKLKINPLATYLALNQISKMPFSSFLKVATQNSEKYAICASPERFLKKANQNLTSQPIKGTVRRGESKVEDEKLKNYLRNSEKERAENMMIVDLVRNDLARSAKVGSTHVSEMFGIYSFEQVHQMISTVEAELSSEKTWIEALKNAFPMGSMTGAPKIRAMQLIEKYEKTKRGLYSGSIGYVSPKGDFDFNVVIRTLFYDNLSKYASFQVGGAITYDSDPRSEWEECLLKAKAIRSLLS